MLINSTMYYGLGRLWFSMYVSIKCNLICIICTSTSFSIVFWLALCWLSSYHDICLGVVQWPDTLRPCGLRTRRKHCQCEDYWAGRQRCRCVCIFQLLQLVYVLLLRTFRYFYVSMHSWLSTCMYIFLDTLGCRDVCFIYYVRLCLKIEPAEDIDSRSLRSYHCNKLYLYMHVFLFLLWDDNSWIS